MTIRRLIAVLIAAGAMTGAVAFAETKTDQGSNLQIVLTSADHRNHQPARMKQDGMTITDGTITEVTPLGARDLELFIVIDDAANYDFSSNLQQLRHFITAQPDAVSIGVAYIHDGLLYVAENPTTDHRRAADALRAPAGSEQASPYRAVSELIRHWEKKSLRREIVLVSAALDESAKEGAMCVDAETAIQDAERGGVIVYALYNPFTNNPSQKLSDADAAVVDLAQVAYETGGENYLITNSPTETIEPVLADISEHLANQYLVKFRLTSSTASGSQSVSVTGGNADQELMAPDKVWLPELIGTGVSGQ